MIIKIGANTFTIKDPKKGFDFCNESVEPKENINIASDGTVYHTYRGKVVKNPVPLNYLTEAQKNAIESLRGMNTTLQIDDGPIRNVRLIGANEWKRERMKGVDVYSSVLLFVKV